MAARPAAGGLPRLRAFGPRAAEGLVAAGRVLPLLDGLDELPGAARDLAVQRIAVAGVPLVVACRTGEYREIVATTDPLCDVPAVEVQAVEPAAAIDQLRSRGGDRWELVIVEVEELAFRAGLAPAIAVVALLLVVLAVAFVLATWQA